jgi:hypothetical protein
MIAFLRGSEPALDILAVGEPGAPAKRTPDSLVYRAGVALGRTLVSGDKRTMSVTVHADLAAGGHNHGVIFLRDGHPVASYGRDLHLIWFCETAEDWVDRIDYIPY